MKRVELFYDYSCPYAYLASTQIEALCEAYGRGAVWRPMLLGGVFRALGVPDSPVLSPAKARLNDLDIHRWADWFGVPFVMPPAHPNRTVLALRATLAAEADAPRATQGALPCVLGAGPRRLPSGGRPRRARRESASTGPP